jgi:hypothetical protein
MQTAMQCSVRTNRLTDRSAVSEGWSSTRLACPVAVRSPSLSIRGGAAPLWVGHVTLKATAIGNSSKAPQVGVFD